MAMASRTSIHTIRRLLRKAKQMSPADKKPSRRGPEPPGMKLLVFVLIMVGLIWVFHLGRTRLAVQPAELSYSEFVEQVRAGKVAKINIEQGDGPSRITGEFVEGEEQKTFEATGPTPGSDVERQIQQLLEEKNVAYDYSTKSRALEIFLQWMLPLLVIGLLLYLMFRRVSDSQGGGALAFGKAKARLVTKESVDVTFEDVAGVEEAKEEVQEIVEFLKHGEKFRRIGARIPRGVILIGPPGCGKTLLAKAIAGEAGVPFYSMSGSDFVEMFVGVGASRVRDLFHQAKANSPAIIFLDEIDAVGRRRGTGLGGGHDEREQTLNAILVEMDGFDTSDQVIVIAATNRPDVLDPALLRPGRFDRRVVVDMSDMKGREAILEVHAKQVKMDESVDLSVMARATVSFSGADLENLINEAALIAVMREHETVQMDDLEEARDKVLWGKERRSRKIEESDRRITAYHEAGHAICSWFTPQVDKPHKITIMPRGISYLGATFHLPEKERYIVTRGQMLGEVVTLYGGIASEGEFCEDVSSGSSNDIKQATDIIRKMVTRWGMSDILGPLSLSDEEEHVFLGYEISRQRQNSEATNEKIDAEIKRVSTECYERAKAIIAEHSADVRKLAETLLEREVVNREEIRELIGPHADENEKESGSDDSREEPGASSGGDEVVKADTSSATSGEGSESTEESAGSDDEAKPGRTTRKRKRRREAPAGKDDRGEEKAGE